LPAGCAIDERDAALHEREKVRTVEPSLPRLRHVQELIGHPQTLRPWAFARFRR
jgi:hypothetical protein